MRCAIWYHLLNSKNVENYREGVLLWVKLPEVSVFHVCFKNCTKAWNFFLSNSLHWCFPRFLNSTNGTKSRRISHKISLSSLMHCKKKQRSGPFFYPAEFLFGSLGTWSRTEAIARRWSVKSFIWCPKVCRSFSSEFCETFGALVYGFLLGLTILYMIQRIWKKSSYWENVYLLAIFSVTKVE